MSCSFKMQALALGALAAGILDTAALAQDQHLAISGGGSTFAAPINKAWIEAYRSIAPNIDISYDVIGSGEGIGRFLDGSLDFATTDAPMTLEQEARVPGGVTHVPVAAGMVAVAYNLPGATAGELRLPREVLGDIFAGEIVQWDDPQLVEANAKLALPHSKIQIVVRQDGSGTTYAFANHLNEISGAWRQDDRGVATLVNWPNTSMKARGNEGVAATILRADGSIGYVEYGIARQAGLPLAALQNKAGAFVLPSAASGEAAIETAELPEDMKINIPDPAGEASYPIVTFTWNLLRKTPRDGDKDEAIRAFTGWAVTKGQAFAPELGYVPLPPTVKARAGLDLAATN